MSVTAEVVLAIVLGTVILGFATTVTFLSFVVYPWIRRRILREQYPNTVMGTKMRTNTIPIPTITQDDVARGFKIFLNECEKRGYDRSKIKAELDPEYMEFVRASNEEGGRYIVDNWGRKIAGDRDGDHMRIVVIDGDTWEKTAGFHEWGHMARDSHGKTTDYEHRDDIMWLEIIPACRKKFAA